MRTFLLAVVAAGLVAAAMRGRRAVSDEDPGEPPATRPPSTEPAAAGPPRDDGTLVVATTVGSRAEAEIIRGMLEGGGIRAIVSTDDSDGWRPYFAATLGVRVLVFDDDLAAARELIDSPVTPAARPEQAPE